MSNDFLGDVMRRLISHLPYQWWAEDGSNWCKTTWKYVFTLQHKGQRVKLMRP